MIVYKEFNCQIEISAREIRSRLSCSGSEVTLENKAGQKILPKHQSSLNISQLSTQSIIQQQSEDDYSSSIATTPTQSDNRLPVVVVSD